MCCNEKWKQLTAITHSLHRGAVVDMEGEVVLGHTLLAGLMEEGEGGNGGQKRSCWCGEMAGKWLKLIG